jgi:hypothetical protein
MYMLFCTMAWQSRELGSTQTVQSDRTASIALQAAYSQRAIRHLERLIPL